MNTRNLVLYADETTFESQTTNGNVNHHGAGIFITDYEIPDIVISESIANLQKDPDIIGNKFDSRTLSEGFFHASEDSKNAHSHFCNSINKYIRGEFTYTYFQEKSPAQDKFRLFNEAFSLSILDIFSFPCNVLIIIEERNDLSKDFFELLLRNFIDDVINSSYEFSWLPTFIPNINFKIENKNNAGLQVVDFLLWSTIRNYKSPKDKTWFSRINKNDVMIHGETESKDMSFGSFNLNYKLKSNIVDDLYPNGYTSIKNIKSISEIWELYLFIELKVKEFMVNAYNSNNYINKILNGLKFLYDDDNNGKPNVNFESLVILTAKVYLSIFDTYELYKGIDKNSEDFEKLLLSKNASALIIRSDIISSVRIRNILVQNRKEYSRNVKK